MGRGPRRASRRRQLGAEPHHRIEAAVTREGRILALRLDQLEDYGAYLAPRCPDRSTACTAPSPAPTTSPMSSDQPHRAHQQDAGEPDPRLRRPAALSRHRAAGAAHRRRARPRPSDVIRRNLIPEASSPTARRPAPSTIPAATTARRNHDRRRPARRAAAQARRGARGGQLYGIGFRRRRARHVEHGLPLDAALRRRPRARRPRTARCPWSPSMSTRWARSR